MSDWNHKTEGGVWLPFFAEGYMGGLGCVGAITIVEQSASKNQPIGFRGAAPGKSLDDRGLLRIRIRAGSRRL